MSDIAHFFTPVSFNMVVENKEFVEGQFGHDFKIYKEGDEFPELENIDMAIIGVCEDRNAVNNEGCALAPDTVRNYLYSLYSGNFRANVVDLGNIMAGHSVDDTYYAVKASIDFLIRKNIVPVIIGGSQDLTYAQFLGYKDLEQTINIASIDSIFDLGNPEDDITNTSYLGKIILHQPNYLFNYSNIGYQTYLVSPSSTTMMTKLYFDAYR
ncbi:MAG TPA: arginase family protein, partial [Bacteroidia bacterium]|nr:arginase family protein [Bacteroidia bacterium]